jgi:hypothetical protein
MGAFAQSATEAHQSPVAAVLSPRLFPVSNIVTIVNIAILVPERFRSDFRHEGALTPAGDVGRQRVREREIGRVGDPHHVGVAPSVHCDARAKIKAAAAQIGGVGQRERGGPGVKAQLADKGISKPSQDAVGGQRVLDRKIGRTRRPPSRRRCLESPQRCHCQHPSRCRRCKWSRLTQGQ